MNGMGAPECGAADFGEAKEADFASINQLADRAGHVFDRDLAVDTMLVEQIDIIGLQSAQGALDRLADRGRAAVGLGAELAAIVEPEAELGGELHLIPPVAEGAAEKLLIGEGTIAFRAVEEVAAQLDGAMKSGDRLRLVRRPVRLAHAHAAEANGANPQALGAQLPLAHCHEPHPSCDRVA